MDRPDPGSAGRAGRGARRGDLPHLRGGRERDRVRRPLRRYSGTIPRINPLVLLDVERAQRHLNRMARSVPLDAPWEAPNAAKLDGQTAATWMRRNLATKAGRTLLELGVEAVWAAQPEDMSLLHMLFYIHSAGSLEMLFDTEGGAQQDRFVGGSQLVPLRMAERLGDERIVLGAPVRRIEHGARRGDGARRWRRLRGRRAILAVAPTLAGADRLRPAAARLPRPAHAAHADGHRGQVHGDLRRALLARRRSLRPGHQRHRPGEAHLRQLAAGRLAGRAARLPRGPTRARAGPPAGRPAPGGGDRLLHAPLRRRAPPRPDAYVERLWAEEEWTRGCYGCHMPTGAWTNYGPALRAPVGPLHWAGAEYAHVWNGYMDGAVRSGEDTAAPGARADLVSPELR